MDTSTDITPDERNENIVTIEAADLPRLEEKFEKLARRAKRLKIDPPRLEVIGIREVKKPTKYTDFDGNRIFRIEHVADVCVEGSRPVVNGWTPVANLVWTNKEAGNVVRAREGFNLPEEYRFRHQCDHCGHNRSRKETWVLQNVETGELKQIGRTCIQDFVGSTELNPAAMAVWGDAWGFAGDEEEGYFGPRVYGVGDYLAAAAACIRVAGFVSKGRAREQGSTSTAEFAFLVMDADKIMTERERKDKGIPDILGDDYQLAEKALEWLKQTDRTSDYIHNLYAAVSLGYVTDKTAGYVASLVGAAFPNAMEREADQRERAANTAHSQHVGEVKQRLDADNVEVILVRGWEGTYGYTTLVKFKTVEGNELQWFASGDKEDDFSCVRRYSIRFTVKRHDRDKVTGNKVTTINRVVAREL